MPTLITNCSNNYGPFHLPEKLIPLSIIKLLLNKEISIYGDGSQIRDWLHVDDHTDALLSILNNGRIGETYNIGGDNELTNLEVVKTICKEMNKILPTRNNEKNNFEKLITFTKDRPGHDLRYAIDFSKLNKELGWKPRHNFSEGIQNTIKWYINNKWWWEPLIKDDDIIKRRGNK